MEISRNYRFKNMFINPAPATSTFEITVQGVICSAIFTPTDRGLVLVPWSCNNLDTGIALLH